jgi:hypothetical protein
VSSTRTQPGARSAEARAAGRSARGASKSARRPDRGRQHRPGGRVPGHRLLLACTAIIALGLLAVLFVNAALSQGAFRQHELEIQLIYAAEKEEALARKVQVDEAPATLERKAAALGMVPAGSPVFLDLATGKIRGEPVPAPSPTVTASVRTDELTAPPERLASRLLVPSAVASAQATATDPAGATGATGVTGATGSSPQPSPTQPDAASGAPINSAAPGASAVPEPTSPPATGGTR